MNKPNAITERRQFGVRWTQVQGWVCVDGWPRLPCSVQNYTEAGGLLKLNSPRKLPPHFVLHLEFMKLRVGCTVKHETGDVFGVEFKPVEEIKKLIAASHAPVSAYEELLAQAKAEHEAAALENAK